MIAVDNPKCPHCDSDLRHRISTSSSLKSYDPTTGLFVLGDEKEETAGLWCPICGSPIDEKDFLESVVDSHDVDVSGASFSAA
jgi:hypothetical protein